MRRKHPSDVPTNTQPGVSPTGKQLTFQRAQIAGDVRI